MVRDKGVGKVGVVGLRTAKRGHEAVWHFGLSSGKRLQLFDDQMIACMPITRGHALVAITVVAAVLGQLAEHTLRVVLEVGPGGAVGGLYVGGQHVAAAVDLQCMHERSLRRKLDTHIPVLHGLQQCRHKLQQRRP